MALPGGSSRREEGGFNPLYAIVLGAGVVLLLAALGLNYWLNRGDSPEEDAPPAGSLNLAPGRRGPPGSGTRPRAVSGSAQFFFAFARCGRSPAV